MNPSFDLSNFAKSLGWSVAGACAAEVPENVQTLFSDWLKKYKGPQMKYLERRFQERVRPKDYFPQAQSILCFGLFYFPGWASGDVKVSNYAWGEDYHERLSRLLEETAQALQKELGTFDYKICVDTAPVLEKNLAAQAGLGWQGKNTLLLNKNFGSFVFLGEIFCSLPLETFTTALPVTDHCGTCRRCIEACPTQALEPYVLHAEKCISYLTLEHKGPFSETTPAFSHWVAGCDICQEVCPWNQRLIPLNDMHKDLQYLTAEDVSSDDWSRRIQTKAVSYVPFENWNRNLSHVSKKNSPA